MKAETKFDVAGVRAAHARRYEYDNGRVMSRGCNCGLRIGSSEHDYHLAAAISAHIAETLGSSDARESVGMAIWRDDRPVSTPGTYADAALAAVGDLLGVEVGR